MKKLRLFLILILILMIATLIAGCSKYFGVKTDLVQNTEIKTTEDENVNNEVIKEEQKLKSKYNVIVNEEDVTFTDARGEMVTLKKNPQRVVCLYNSYLDIWDNCGGTVIGRVEKSEEKPVENAKSAEEVGTAGAPSLEKIIALQPDLIIMTTAYTGQREIISTLEKSNIQVVALDNDYMDDYLGTVKLFTALTGREDLYEKQALEVEKNVEEIIKKAPKDRNYKILLLFATSKSLSVRDSKSMVGEMLKDLNTVNISDSEVETADTKTFSMEKILQEDPDFIFVLTMGNDMEKIQERLKSDAEDNPAWASLSAVKEDRYIVLPKDIYMYKPNNRYPEAYEGLAEILYPEVFK